MSKIVDLIKIEMNKNREKIEEEISGLVNEQEVYMTVLKLLARCSLTNEWEKNARLQAELQVARKVIMDLKEENFNLKEGLQLKKWNKVCEIEVKKHWVR